MYIPRAFAATDRATLQRLIRAHPLATLVTFCGTELNANHIPLVLDSAAGDHGCLQGHVPRANPLSINLDSKVEALAIFHGPEGYISPSWYPSKRQTGKVVPTWNYAVVHAYGRLEVIDDPVWVRAQLEALTRQNEAAFDNPWQVADAPRDFTDRMIAALLGIEIKITRLHGKIKASQNQPAANRAGVVAGLGELGTESADELAVLTLTADDN